LGTAGGTGRQPERGQGLAAGQVREGGHEPRVVLAQDGAELAGGLLAVPDGVLVSAGEHPDAGCQLGVVGDEAVHARVSAHDVGQHDRVGGVALGPAGRVPVAVAGDRERIDGVHPDAGRAQVRHQQPFGGLDRDRDGRVAAVAVDGEQLHQLGEAAGGVLDPGPDDQRAGLVDDHNVVVLLGPVDPTPTLHLYLLESSSSCELRRKSSALMIRPRRAAIASAVHVLSLSPAGPDLRQSSRLRERKS
jgi:hypothetical protein